MSSEAPTTSASALSSRAGIALLTLQLRAAVQEALAAEAEEAAANEQGARAALRARLEPLLAQRRAELDAEIVQTRAESAVAIAAAHRAAQVILSNASAPEPMTAPVAVAPPESTPLPVDDIAPEPTVVPVVEVVPEPTVVPVVEVVPEPNAVTVVEVVPEPTVVTTVLPLVDVPATPVATAVAARRDEPGQPPTLQMAPINVVIDADAFARVFAAVIGTLLEERPAASASAMYAPVYSPLALPTAAPVKQSFWSHAKHVDVLLLSGAMVIVLVVLAAWMA
ncbi:MAG: hypothetical protein WCC60_07600 [Ilumatobacteraceae bacterium]